MSMEQIGWSETGYAVYKDAAGRFWRTTPECEHVTYSGPVHTVYAPATGPSSAPQDRIDKAEARVRVLEALCRSIYDGYRVLLIDPDRARLAAAGRGEEVQP